MGFASIRKMWVDEVGWWGRRMKGRGGSGGGDGVGGGGGGGGSVGVLWVSSDGRHISLAWQTCDQSGLKLSCYCVSCQDHYQSLTVLSSSAGHSQNPPV